MNHNTKQFLISLSICVLGAIAVAGSVYYLITGNLIPGVIPLSTALLMLPLWNVYSTRVQTQSYMKWLFVGVFLLNLLTGVLQIVNALSK